MQINYVLTFCCVLTILLAWPNLAHAAANREPKEAIIYVVVSALNLH